MWIATFQPLTAGLYQAMVSTEHVSLYVAPWLFVIGAFWSSLWLFFIGGFRSPLFWYSFHIAVMGRRCLDFNDGKVCDSRISGKVGDASVLAETVVQRFGKQILLLYFHDRKMLVLPVSQRCLSSSNSISA